MDKRYVTLFKELTQKTAASAEIVMDYDREQGDEKGLETAKTMRDDYQALTDTIAEKGDDYVPTKSEAAKLVVAAMIMVNQLQDKMNALKKAIAGYQTDIIPKLKDIMEAESDEEAQTMSNEKFVIKNEE